MDGAYDILDSSMKKVKTGLQNVWQVLFDCRWSLKSLPVRQFSAMWALELCQYLSACSDVLGVWHHWGFRPLKITTVFIIAIFQMLVSRRSIKMAEKSPCTETWYSESQNLPGHTQWIQEIIGAKYGFLVYHCNTQVNICWSPEEDVLTS